MEVPTVSEFKDIYPQDAIPVQTKRWNNLLSKFEQDFGRKAEFVSRSPGRVNIIGEHIDYSLYQVLPMAVTVDVLLAVTFKKHDGEAAPKIRIANVDSKYPRREFTMSATGDVEINAEEHEWTNYFKAGLKGATELLRKKKGEKGILHVDMDILVDGSVPAGGGLSSSAAFVCASALAVMKANSENEVDKTELTEVAIVAERSVGVNSGGMDQSASVFAQTGCALLVDFKPSLTAKPVHFPKTGPSLTFLIAQSLVTSDKHVTAPICYNLRVVECTLAAHFLAAAFKLKKALPSDSSPLGSSLRGFHDTFFEEKDGIADNTKTSPEVFKQQLEQLIQLAGDYLIQEDGYTRQDIAKVLKISVEDLNQKYTTKVPVRAERFMLRQRVLHVFSEALRVQQTVSLLSDDSTTKAADVPEALGALLNETQKSCREDFECSCPELDELCDIARAAGSWGSRLTGAGWGGCSVHLVPEEKVEAVRSAWEEKYYKKHFPDMSKEKLEEAIVSSQPGRGSCLWEVKTRTEV